MDDDRRAVPAQGARHHGWPGAVVGLLLHIRHGQGVAGPDGSAGHGRDHVAVRRGGRGRRVLHSRVFARDAWQDPAADRKTVRQRPERGHLQRRRPQGQRFQIQRVRVLHQLHSGRVQQGVT